MVVADHWRPLLYTIAKFRPEAGSLDRILPRAEESRARLVKRIADSRLADRQGQSLRYTFQNVANNQLSVPFLAHFWSPSCGCDHQLKSRNGSGMVPLQILPDSDVGEQCSC